MYVCDTERDGWFVVCELKHTHTRVKLQALHMHIHMITQLSTHLCCHGNELMKRTKEREHYTERERTRVLERWRVSPRTIFYSVVKEEYAICLMGFLSFQVSHEFAINFDPTNPFCSGELVHRTLQL